jgi:NADPH:quinone reductase-like Zn-dependent oxidoreductase
MKAVVYKHYGPPEVLQIEELPEPTPKDNEVLIKVAATTVTRYDCWARSADAHTGMGLLMKLYQLLNEMRLAQFHCYNG